MTEQCAAGPLVHGQFVLTCENGNWAIANHGIPCHDNEADARASETSQHGFVPQTSRVQRLTDVTGIVNRMRDQGTDIKCCCNARLDSSLWANWRIHRRWNSRASGHTGVCTVHPGDTRCSRTDSLTKGHERTEGARCIVDDADRANWESVLHLNRPSGPRFAQTNVPTVSSQGAEEYRDCVPEHSLGECERCTHGVQCAEGWYCCPFMKVCVQDSTTQCNAMNIAQCSGCFERFTPNPEQCTCENPAFPRSWLPECHSGGWR